MAANSSDSDSAAQTSASAAPPPVQSCRKKKSEGATFLQDVRDHIDEFIHASMDEHKECFKNTVKKLFGTMKSKEEAPAPTSSVESVLPLKSVTSSSS